MHICSKHTIKRKLHTHNRMNLNMRTAYKITFSTTLSNQLMCPCKNKQSNFDNANAGILLDYERPQSTSSTVRVTAWFVIICLNKCHVIAYCLSSNSNTSFYWQLFWKHATNEKTWQSKCIANKEWSQFTKGIHSYKQREANWTLHKAGRV